MPLAFTNPLLDEITPQLKRKIERAYIKFPELSSHQVVFGITFKRRVDAYAVIEDFCIRLNLRHKTGTTYYTIGHELTHLLQKPGLGVVPDGEVQCDIWTLARSELFLDEMPSYLDVHPCSEESWTQHARTIRELCIRAIQVRRSNRRYIVWLRNNLKNTLQSHFSGPRQLSLFPLHQIL